MEIIGEEDIGQECKVLGISWNKANDEFVFELAKFASGFIEMAVTKRKVVSVVAQLFDQTFSYKKFTHPMLIGTL